jgi:hypothetical protein
MVNMGKANWVPLKPAIPPPSPPTISMLSPENMTYHSKNVTLSFAVTVSLQDGVKIRDWNPEVEDWDERNLQSPQDRAEISRISYSLDVLENNITVPIRSASLRWSTTLQGLSEGTHTIRVNASGRYAATVWVIFVSPYKPPLLDSPYQDTAYSSEVGGYSEVTFTIDASSPNISILSPTNNAHRPTDLQLNFTVNEPVSWMGYSLDGHANVTVAGNTTFPELAHGSHNLTVYAQDSAGYIVASETICFGVEPFPTTLVVAPIASVTFVGVGLLVYFRKRKRSALAASSANL